MPEYEYKDEFFNCNNLGERVRITRKFLIHRSARSAGAEIDLRKPTKIECNGLSEECGVRIRKGNIFATDWSKCVHPDLKQ